MYSQTGVKQYLFFIEMGKEEAGTAGFKDCIPPSPPKDASIFIDILPCWKGPGGDGRCQAENEPTAYSLITDKANLILATLSVWPADQEKLLPLSTQCW